MEEKKSKIKSYRFVSEWQGEKGIVYYHEIELENGDKGQIGTKEKNPDKLAVGQELSYTLESTSRGNKIKAVVSSFAGGGHFNKKLIDPRAQFIGFSYAYSKDLVVGGKLAISDFHKIAAEIFNNMIKLHQTIK